MNFPCTLTERLLEFVLDNHHLVRAGVSTWPGPAHDDAQRVLRTGIEDILVDAVESQSMKAPPALPVTDAITEATQSIWDTVLGSFDDNVWLDKDERIVFFARWETDFKQSTATVLTQLLEDV